MSADDAKPTHRLHQQATRAVLKELLPESDSDDIKGSMHSFEELLQASGYAHRPADFDAVMHLLDHDLRLITPTDPEVRPSERSEDRVADPAGRYYQLTHDYLVPSLRDWLTRKQKETRRGRAELRLVERSAQWNARSDNRNLPSWWEYLNIRLLTRGREWTKPQRALMRRTRQVLSVRWSIVLVTLLGLGIGIERLRTYVSTERVRTVITGMSNSRGILVPRTIKELQLFPSDLVADELARRFADTEDDRKLSLAYALADPHFGRVDRQCLIHAISGAHSEECDNIATALAHDLASALEDLQSAAAAATLQKDWKLKTRLATIALYLKDTSIAAEMLQAEPTAPPESRWHDPPLDPGFSTYDDVTQATVITAHGMLEERFAFCLDMPWDTFLTTIETLRPSGYRPTRVRPFVHGDQQLVAAIWTRNGGRWQLDSDLRAEKLPLPESRAEKDGLVPADVAAYPGEDGATSYCVLWSQPIEEDEQRRVRVAMTKDELEATTAQMVQAGLRRQTTLQVTVSEDGTRRYAGIWSDRGQATQADPLCSQRPRQTDEIVWEDLSIAGAGKPPHPLNVLRQQLAALAQLPPVEQDTPGIRLLRAKSLYYLDQPWDALSDLGLLMAQSSPTADALLYSALCRAQLGQGEEALAAVAMLFETTQDTSYRAAGQVLTQAWLGKIEEAKRGVDDSLIGNQQNSVAIYNAACVLAQLTRILSASDPTEIAAWKRRSLELIRRACAMGLSGSADIENNPDFIPLYDNPDFQSLVAEFTGNRYYAVVWQKGSQCESWFDADLSLRQQQETARRRVADGFRPVAAAIDLQADPSQPRSVVIWQRPRLVPPPLPRWDPVQRTMFIEYFPKWTGNVEKLVDVLEPADNAPLHSGISLALGSMENATAEARRAWEPLLRDWHRSQTDGGVHSATLWALQSWDLSPPSRGMEYRESEGCNWYATKMGLTMMHIPAGVVQRPADRDAGESSKTIRILTDFWLSDREVTAGQFLRFLGDKSAEKPDQPDVITRQNNGDPSRPVVFVSWYDSVMFCNWLSRQEGRDPCYRKDGKEQIRYFDNIIGEYDAWKLVPGANGYRLPTEDEWEYACRARTATAFSFGDAAELLDRYAVFINNAGHGPDLVGCKLCNAWGLFDMHGNVWERCQDWHVEGSHRVDRGGGWNFSASNCRTAARSWSQRSALSVR